MCTMIVKQIAVEGYAKGKSDWFEVRQAYVTYDHPFKAPFEHALNIDLVNEAQGPADTWNASRTSCSENKFRYTISPNSVQKGDLPWRAHLQVS